MFCCCRAALTLGNESFRFLCCPDSKELGLHAQGAGRCQNQDPERPKRYFMASRGTIKLGDAAQGEASHKSISGEQLHSVPLVLHTLLLLLLLFSLPFLSYLTVSTSTSAFYLFIFSFFFFSPTSQFRGVSKWQWYLPVCLVKPQCWHCILGNIHRK